MFCFLNIFPSALAQNETTSLQNNVPGEETELNQNSLRDINTEPMNTESIKKSVIPDPAKEGKKVIGLFLKTMAGVGFSILLLYLFLILLKKYYPHSFSVSDCEEYENLDLSIPNNKNDALKSFLNRTK